jgi:hypothetical protein
LRPLFDLFAADPRQHRLGEAHVRANEVPQTEGDCRDYVGIDAIDASTNAKDEVIPLPSAYAFVQALNLLPCAALTHGIVERPGLSVEHPELPENTNRIAFESVAAILNRLAARLDANDLGQACMLGLQEMEAVLLRLCFGHEALEFRNLGQPLHEVVFECMEGVADEREANGSGNSGGDPEPHDKVIVAT